MNTKQFVSTLLQYLSEPQRERWELMDPRDRELRLYITLWSAIRSRSREAAFSAERVLQSLALAQQSSWEWRATETAARMMAQVVKIADWKRESGE